MPMEIITDVSEMLVPVSVWKKWDIHLLQGKRAPLKQLETRQGQCFHNRIIYVSPFLNIVNLSRYCYLVKRRE